MDTFRDAGFVQGIVDGNWFGDPAIGGAWRYYPPLVHALFAAVSAPTGIAPLRLLIASAPWVNLIVPLGFFLMGRAVLGAPAAACGTAVLVLFNGLVLPPWISAAYHPWSSIPMLALGVFFLSLWLIYARIHSEKFIDACLIGSAVGLTFLAHTVPALILASVVPILAWSAKGLTFKTARWLTIVGLVALMWSLLLLLPLLVSYHLHILNTRPGAYVDPLFASSPSRSMLLELLPGALALPILRLLRSEGVLSREAVATLAVWILVPVIFLSRHYACSPESQSAACTVFVVAVHHWYIYLQAAMTCLSGFALWLCLRRALRVTRLPRSLVLTAGMAAALCATLLFCQRPSDHYMRQRAIALSTFFDWDVYLWVTQHSAPHDLFVTETLNDSLNAASLAVMTAGRSSVSLPATYSNPYVKWESRNNRSRGYLEAARTMTTQGSVVLCDLQGEGVTGANIYVILPNTETITTHNLSLATVGANNAIYRAMPKACAAPDPTRLVAQSR